MMNFQNSRKINSTNFQFETVFGAIAESSSCSEHGETKDTSSTQTWGDSDSGVGIK